MIDKDQMKQSTLEVTIDAPPGVAADEHLPLLSHALDQQFIQEALRQLRGEYASAQLRAIRVTRYKPGRRCVLEYDLQWLDNQQHSDTLTLIGKARRKRSGNKDVALLQNLRRAGFGSNSEDGIAVPEPIGVIEGSGIWLQQKVDGGVLTEMLDSAEAPRLMRRVAEAAYKLHKHGGAALTGRVHTLETEIEILRERLRRVAHLQPAWATRLEDLLAACETLAATLQPITCSIHRDFYPDQVIVDRDGDCDRLWLIDFDLFCAGHPAIDIGNFIAHLTEQALRTHADAEHYADLENTLRKHYLDLADDVPAYDIHAATLLSLVRHISLSSEISGRQHLTADLLTLCEARLARLKESSCLS